MSDEYLIRDESDFYYRVQDAFIRQIIADGIGVIYPDKMELEKKKVRHRMEYIAERLRWPRYPFAVWIDLYHYLWLTQLINYEHCIIDCCGGTGLMKGE